MQEFFLNVGLDWKLLLSQAVNFLILLIVLRIFAYKPILKVLKERRQRIEEGITKAEEADRRLERVDQIRKEKLQEAEREGLLLLRTTEEKAKVVEATMLSEARKKEAELLAKAQKVAEARKMEARRDVEHEAAVLVKNAIIKTTELDPKLIDTHLIDRAVASVRTRS